MVDDMKSNAKGCPPSMCLVWIPKWDQRPPYGAYRIPLVDGATVTGEMNNLGWTAP